MSGSGVAMAAVITFCIYLFAMVMTVVAFGAILGPVLVAVVLVYALFAWGSCLGRALRSRNVHWVVDLFLAPTSSLLGILVIGPAIAAALARHPGAGVINLSTHGGSAILVDLLAAAVGLAGLALVLYMLVATPVMLGSESAGPRFASYFGFVLFSTWITVIVVSASKHLPGF